jgi:acyl-CoA synthetase (AMP-forming)/AMP-acid ligase II
MSSPSSRLQKLTAHFVPSSSASAPSTTTSATSPPHIHTLSPTSFLPRAAEIEPDAEAIVHITANGQHLRRNYAEFADRARGLAYFLRKHNFRRVGILCPNTPAFLEAIFGIAASGGVNVAVNYRLKVEDVQYIFEFSEVDVIIVDEEYLPLLAPFRESNPNIPFIIDTDTDATEGQLSAGSSWPPPSAPA